MNMFAVGLLAACSVALTACGNSRLAGPPERANEATAQLTRTAGADAAGAIAQREAIERELHAAQAERIAQAAKVVEQPVRVAAANGDEDAASGSSAAGIERRTRHGKKGAHPNKAKAHAKAAVQAQDAEPAEPAPAKEQSSGAEKAVLAQRAAQQEQAALQRHELAERKRDFAERKQLAEQEVRQIRSFKHQASDEPASGREKLSTHSRAAEASVGGGGGGNTGFGRGAAARAAAPETDALPGFPWPPPAASAFGLVPLRAMLDQWRSRHYWPAYPHGASVYMSPPKLEAFYQAEPLLTHADYSLRYILAAAGYSEASYYSVPGGFALVSRMEQIESDGRSKPVPGRWENTSSGNVEFSIANYLRVLFTAPPGYYRILVFVVTPRPFTQSAVAASKETAQSWLGRGSNALPDDIGNRGLSGDFNCTALIYEFEKTADKPAPRSLVPGRLTAATHLAQAGLGGISP